MAEPKHPKNRRTLRGNLSRPIRLFPTAPASTRHAVLSAFAVLAACALASKRRHPYAHAAIRRHLSDSGATNDDARAHRCNHVSKHPYPHAHVDPALDLSPRRRRLYADNRRQNPRLRATRKRRRPLLGARRQ